MATSPTTVCETASGTNEMSRFYYEYERLNSFVDWPVTFLSPALMAAAGFYYFKKGDTVRCPFCSVEVGNWMRGDCPVEDHKKFSPKCKFLLNRDCANIPLGCVQKDDSPGPSLAMQLSKMMIRKTHPVAFPYFSNISSRLGTFKSWTGPQKISVHVLSEAGFFHTGQSDQTVCFSCGGGLKDWVDDDDPWLEHARWFSKCNFLLLMKGIDFVNEACGRKKPIEPQTAFVPPRGDIEKGVCKVCFENEVMTLFIPCRHLVTCNKCAVVLKKCAVCRQDIEGTLRVFLS